MTAVTIGVPKERAPGERRVALVPDSVRKLTRAGLRVLVEPGAGIDAWCSDEAYADAGALLCPVAQIRREADVMVALGEIPPDLPHAGQIVICQARPLAQAFADAGVTAISLDGLPRTLSAAQTMDALTSQANIAGYKAAVLAADTYERFFPMMVTAAGTARPAQVLVLGAGVAGLQAIGTARRLGAVVTAHDVRPQARDDIVSVGAAVLDLAAPSAGSQGGYATELDADAQHSEQRLLAERIAHFDVVITTARVPGRRPPLLVTEEAVKAMRPGSVIIDLAAGEHGGNVAGVRHGASFRTDNGVTLIGADDLPATMPAAASAAYSHNITALLLHLLRDGAFVIDLADPIQDGIVVAHEGTVR